MSSPTQRTLKNLRDNGYLAQVVEKYNMFAHVRQDLFGCIDVVGIKEGVNGVLGVQSTSSSNTSARYKKSIAIPAVKVWLSAGNRFLIQGFAKNSKGRYILKEIEVTLKDLL
jgi:hypothetical protein